MTRGARSVTVMVISVALGAGCAMSRSDPRDHSMRIRLGYTGSAGPGEAGPSYAAFGEPFDEVWVIRRPDAGAPPADAPRSGELRALVASKEVPLPLEHTDVKAQVQGFLASVKVTQRYHNPYDAKIEAVYVFPLPESAAVTDFVMQIGERRIRGIVRERAEAERTYAEARRQGYAAALLAQERPNVFTQKVANIEPGKRIDVEIRYFHALAFSRGEYSFVFPMIVGPRYNPAGSTDGIGAVPRDAKQPSGQRTEVRYLRPGERSGHDVMVEVDLDAGMPIEALGSTSHAIDVVRPSPDRARITLRPLDAVPDRDFILTYRVAGAALKAGFAAERTPEGKTFAVLLQPPGRLADLPRSDLELVFVVDVSGSQMGWPIEKSKAAIRRALRKMGPGDTFQLVRFAGRASTFGHAPVPATPVHVQDALAWLDDTRGGGGTEMLAGIRAALDIPHDPHRLRVVAFFTDGYIGDEEQIFAAVGEKLGPSRIFAFGVGSAVNRHLVEGLARLGRGAVAYLTSGSGDVSAVDDFFDTIAHPALTDVTVDWGAVKVSDVYPKRVPDLFVGRPVVLLGRFEGTGRTTIRISGMAGGERHTHALDVDLSPGANPQASLSKMWARARIADLSDAQARGGGEDVAAAIRKTALRNGLLSAYTAFVAVDATRVTEGSEGTTVPVAVPVPEGVKYETTVREEARP